MFMDIPFLTCEDDLVKTMNYLILALTAYKAAAEVIFDRLVNVTIICQIIKPLLTLQRYKNLLRLKSSGNFYIAWKCYKYLLDGNAWRIS